MDAAERRLRALRVWTGLRIVAASCAAWFAGLVFMWVAIVWPAQGTAYHASLALGFALGALAALPISAGLGLLAHVLLARRRYLGLLHYTAAGIAVGAILALVAIVALGPPPPALLWLLPAGALGGACYWAIVVWRNPYYSAERRTGQ